MNGQPVVWIIGLPNSGKSTVARELKSRLDAAGRSAVILDGDEIRVILEMQDSHYDLDSRMQNALRIGRLARLLSQQGVLVIVAANTVFWKVQEYHREHLPGYFEVYLRCDEATRRGRDQEKGLYERYDRCEVRNVLGLDLAAEEPRNPEVLADVSKGGMSAHDVTEIILQNLDQVPAP